MKNYIILILSLSILFKSYSQNWELFNKNSYYHYKDNITSNYSNSILIDSFKLVGTDTLFYLNLVCSPQEVIFENLRYNYKTPQFLNTSILKTDSGYFFISQIHFLLII
jgi:hypothetical protein